MNIVILGVGAQGSTIAKHASREPGVRSVVCADYAAASAMDLARQLGKTRGVQVDARDRAAVIQVARGCDLLVNALPPDFNMTLMEAALEVGCHYQDLASGPVADTDFISAVKRQLALDQEFKDRGLGALTNTGSAPGLVSILARHAADQLDQVERIEVIVYDGVWTRKFIPFWWSPETAFGDMAARPINYVNGEFVEVPPFNDPVMVDFKGLGRRRVVDHEHEEPVTFGLFADRAFKGCRNVSFKYGGPAVDLAETLYKLGLLNTEPVNVKGTEIVPLELVCQLTPPAPASSTAVKEALAEGMVSEEGACLVRVSGQKAGAPSCVENYVNAPGLTEAFEKHGLTHETFLTGQAAFMFTKLFIEGRIDLTGVFTPELLDHATRCRYLAGMARLGVTVDEYCISRLA